MSTSKIRFGWSWVDLGLYAVALVLLVPLAIKFLETILEALE